MSNIAAIGVRSFLSINYLSFCDRFSTAIRILVGTPFVAHTLRRWTHGNLSSIYYLSK